MEPHSGFENGCIVTVNGKQIQPDAYGTYTVPAGEDYAQINCYPAPSAASSDGGVCKYCGQTHTSSLWGRLVALFHAIAYFFKHIFG